MMTDYLSLPQNDNEYVIITTNGIIKKNGLAVMGAGLAKLAAQTYPQLPEQLAYFLEIHGNRCFRFPQYKVITFPTKYHFKDKSDIDLIVKSLEELKLMIEKFDIQKVYMPRVGCRNGQLEWSEVKPVIEFHLCGVWDKIEFTEP
jgi:hypothetical protein